VSLLHVSMQRSLKRGSSSSVEGMSGANASSVSASPPHAIEIPALYLHPGKTGGGTVDARFRLWNVRVAKTCHPHPCRSQVRKAQQVLISIRDPVDTFESAFNWRTWELCSAKNETRKAVPTDLTGDDWFEAAWHTDQFCRDYWFFPKEARILQKKYAGNPNNLAEAMCDGGRVGEEARLDWKQIRHAQEPLSDWLPKHGLEKINLAAMVLEPGFDFEDQIFSVARWAVSQSLGDDVAHDLDIRNKSMIEQVSDEDLHSSAQSSYHPPPLSKLGQCCMARHLATSYELIPKLATSACKGSLADACKAALTSIYTRRQVFLNSSISCQELTPVA